MDPEPIRVLLVDDDEDDFILTRNLLSEVEGRRYRLDWVGSFEAGARAVARGAHDAYLVDYDLGDGSGLELLERAVANGCTIPMILLTGQGGDDVDLSAMRAGAADFLMKGHVDAAQLERSIRHAIDRARAREALRDSQERYELAAAGSQDGLWDYDVRTGGMYFSPRWKEMLGYESDEIESLDDWFDLVHPDELGQLKSDLLDHLSGVSGRFQNEHQIRYKDGAYRWVLCRGAAVRDRDRAAYRIAGSLTDIHKQKQIEERLQFRAHHDELTGLPNRAFFRERLERAILYSKDTPAYRFALLFLDFDRFKLINDSLGHEIGDQFLKEIARRLECCLSAHADGEDVFNSAMTARLGGDEFTVLLEGRGDTADAERVAEKLQAVLSEPYELEGHEIVSSVSVGIVGSDMGHDSADELLRDADTAMYRAKSRGKACHVVFDQCMHDEACAVMRLENDLRHAQRNKQLRLQYQPIVSLETGGLLGFEALVRWRHPIEGVINPDRFIPIAEDSGLIIPIGEWILQEACRQLAEWRDRYSKAEDIYVSVNLSKRQVLAPDLVDDVLAVLAANTLAPADLKLEITESVIVEGLDAVNNTLQQLRERGLTLVMDDFGTGRSSLSCLHDFPVEILKIDRAFLAGIVNNRPLAAVVNAIVTLAHNLNLKVVAEGVDTEEQLAQLLAFECDKAQGFLFARPLDPDVAGRFIIESGQVRRLAG